MSAPGPARPGDLVTVTHRLHPLRGRQLLVRAVHGRCGTEALVCERPGGGLVTVLRSWTDRAPGAPAPCREARPHSTGGAFRVSDAALHRLRASLTMSVGWLVGLDDARTEHPPEFLELHV